MSTLHNLTPAKGSVKSRKRIARGQGSGYGGTSTRGHKGAKSRSGYSKKIGFEGGQMPLQRRVPKFGFKNLNRVAYKVINLDTVQGFADKFGVNVVDFDFLVNHGYVSSKDLVKVLNRGELTSPVEIKLHAFSASAQEAIEKVGGKAIKL